MNLFKTKITSITTIKIWVKIRFFLCLQRRGGSRGGSRRVSYRRGRREAVPEFSDEEGARFITEFLQEYQAAHQ